MLSQEWSLRQYPTLYVCLLGGDDVKDDIDTDYDRVFYQTTITEPTVATKQRVQKVQQLFQAFDADHDKRLNCKILNAL